MKKHRLSPSAVDGIGARLRAVRMDRGLTLRDLAARTKMPISTLSKMENGQTAFTYEKLLLLKDALAVDLEELVATQPSTPPANRTVGRRSVTRADEGTVVGSGSTHQHRHLATDVLHKSFTPMIGEVTARTMEEFGPFLHHGGEEFVYVLEGRLELHTEVYAPVQLGVGDSAFFDAHMGHAYLCASPEPCRILSVCSTPR